MVKRGDVAPSVPIDVPGAERISHSTNELYKLNGWEVHVRGYGRELRVFINSTDDLPSAALKVWQTFAPYFPMYVVEVIKRRNDDLSHYTFKNSYAREYVVQYGKLLAPRGAKGLTGARTIDGKKLTPAEYMRALDEANAEAEKQRQREKEEKARQREEELKAHRAPYHEYIDRATIEELREALHSLLDNQAEKFYIDEIGHEIGGLVSDREVNGNADSEGKNGEKAGAPA